MLRKQAEILAKSVKEVKNIQNLEKKEQEDMEEQENNLRRFQEKTRKIIFEDEARLR